MQIQQSGRKLEATLEANLKAVEKFCCVVKKFLAQHAKDVNHFTVLLLIREAVNNAVLHGSQHIPGAKVLVRLEYEVGQVLLTVRDSGPGFDWRAALEKKMEPLAETGRGLPILRSYAASVQYNEAGNELNIIIRSA
ncbi:MAG: serine/threonine-protein kinase RsbW [Desulfovibrionales bacterium]|jgi:serine/threonine-protein kinase RsbW|nr:serine/threonine-protein kinase RsbW [Desulfovibrionales bacterium]